MTTPDGAAWLWISAGSAFTAGAVWLAASQARSSARSSKALAEVRADLHRTIAALAAATEAQASSSQRLVESQAHVATLEERLARAQKLEVMGQMAGGIAHDFNNILTVIQVEGAMAREQVADGSPTAEHLDELLQACGRAAALSSRLLFGRRRTGVRKPLALDAEVRDLETLLARLAGEQHRLVLQLSAENAHVLADPTQIQQLLTNLVANARDAMPGGGRVLVRTALRFAEEGLQLRIDVQDEGRGMDPDTQARMFDPLFTTKPEGQGTGFGLATVYDTVRSLSGSIEVHSEQGVGTVISLVLPVVVPALAEAPKPVETPPPVRERTSAAGVVRWSILLVEDQDSVREAVRRALERLGCLVVPVRSGKDALRQLEKGVDRFDVLLADVIMPAMTGVELAEIVRHRRPNLRVLLMSGHLSDEVLIERLQRLDVPVLRKPFTPEELLDAVSERLQPVRVSS